MKTRFLLAAGLFIAGCAHTNKTPAPQVVSVAKPPSTVPSLPNPPTTSPTAEQLKITGTETLVFLRHGEKPSHGLGQLTPQGLNRAIALSSVLPAKYGKPDFIFAPDPVMTEVSEGGSVYFYIRPLETIEPTAILLGMPVQTPYGFAQIDKLNSELTSPKYANATIFIAWEHGYEAKAVVNLVAQFHGNVAGVPRWHGNDYDSLFVVRINRVAGQASTVSFTHDQENLDHLSTTMPSAAASQPTTSP